MVIALWIVVPIIAYLFIAGGLRSSFAAVSARRCQECKNGKHPVVVRNDYGPDRTQQIPAKEHHGTNGAVQAAFWPFTLPWTLGSMIGEGDRTQKKAVKAESRRTQEIAEAEHQVELARLRKKENDYLDQHLKLEEIRGRVQDK